MEPRRCGARRRHRGRWRHMELAGAGNTCQQGGVPRSSSHRLLARASVVEACRLSEGSCGKRSARRRRPRRWMLRSRRTARWRRRVVEIFFQKGRERERADGAVASGEAAYVRSDALTRALPLSKLFVAFSRSANVIIILPPIPAFCDINCCSSKPWF